MHTTISKTTLLRSVTLCAGFRFALISHAPAGHHCAGAASVMGW
jgi:hypothetical protein